MTQKIADADAKLASVATLASTLELAKSYIADPKNWLQANRENGYEPMRDANGNPASKVSQATCMCVGFAIVKASTNQPALREAAYDYVAAKINAEPDIMSIGHWNDLPTTTHQDVLELLS